jgi:hypothetical protein
MLARFERHPQDERTGNEGFAVELCEFGTPQFGTVLISN